MKTVAGLFLAVVGLFNGPGVSSSQAEINVYLTDVPDYDWWAGCFGTASGNLMGFWDRHGFPDFYTGPTAGGMAPLNSNGTNSGIFSLWASQAGLDGRPANQYGHYDDYYVAYESTDPDPYVVAGRPEHSPDCLGDFIGLNQWKWTNMAGECDGNIDGYCFVYWDASGSCRVNFVPDPSADSPARDLPSGLRAWTTFRGYDSTVFSQLTDFNPAVPPGAGFSFEAMKAEIEAGYPVLLFLQDYQEVSRPLNSLLRVNPHIHGMLAYGYLIDDYGNHYVRYRTSWASGDNRFSLWGAQTWEGDFPMRGVIGYHPQSRLRSCRYVGKDLVLQWDGPSAILYDSSLGESRLVHGYVVEMATHLSAEAFSPISPVLSDRSYTVTNCPTPAFFRVKLVPR
jgi:hypothetical protein